MKSSVLGKALLIGVFGSAAGVGVSTYYTYDLLTTAQKQIQDLHAQVSRQEATEKLKIDELIQYQKREDRGLDHLAGEIARVKNELENAYRKKEGLIKEVLNETYVENIKLLEKAHVRHVSEELQAQYSEMEGLFQNELDKHLQSQKKGYYEDLAISISKLNELEQILNSRLDLDKSEKKARVLWSICQTLKDALKSESDLNRPIPLRERFAAFDALSKQFEDNPLIKNVIATINEHAVQKGVYSEDSLIERFKKVDKNCRRVALIGDEPASIYQYLVSYIQSVLLFDSVKTPICPGELDGRRPVDPSKWDCHAILARVNTCLANRNLEQAVRYSNQLRGAARKVANDWIRDARLHLELKQALDVIQNEASSYTVKSLS